MSVADNDQKTLHQQVFKGNCCRGLQRNRFIIFVHFDLMYDTLPINSHKAGTLCHIEVYWHISAENSIDVEHVL